MIRVRLMNLFGLDAKNSQHTAAVEEALHGIVRQNKFYDFCASQKDGIEFQAKTEKLLTLSRRYRKIEEEQSLPKESAKTFAARLTRKFGAAKTTVKNAYDDGKPAPISNLYSGGAKYFTDKEISALASIGSTWQIINAYETGRMEAEIEAKYISNAKALMCDGESMQIQGHSKPKPGQIRRNTLTVRGR